MKSKTNIFGSRYFFRVCGYSYAVKRFECGSDHIVIVFLLKKKHRHKIVAFRLWLFHITLLSTELPQFGVYRYVPVRCHLHFFIAIYHWRFQRKWNLLWMRLDKKYNKRNDISKQAQIRKYQNVWVFEQKHNLYACI